MTGPSPTCGNARARRGRSPDAVWILPGAQAVPGDGSVPRRVIDVAMIDRWISPEPRTAAELVRSSAAIMTQRHGHRLDERLTSTGQADLPAINRFANGGLSGLGAVTAEPSLPSSSGPIEGNVNRIRMLNGRCVADPASAHSARAWQPGRRGRRARCGTAHTGAVRVVRPIVHDVRKTSADPPSARGEPSS
jgi:hypothetical protein